MTTKLKFKQPYIHMCAYSSSYICAGGIPYRTMTHGFTSSDLNETNSMQMRCNMSSADCKLSLRPPTILDFDVWTDLY